MRLRENGDRGDPLPFEVVSLDGLHLRSRGLSGTLDQRPQGGLIVENAGIAAPEIDQDVTPPGAHSRRVLFHVSSVAFSHKR